VYTKQTVTSGIRKGSRLHSQTVHDYKISQDATTVIDSTKFDQRLSALVEQRSVVMQKLGHLFWKLERLEQRPLKLMLGAQTLKFRFEQLRLAKFKI
jgi:hypothetical protein